MMLCRVVSVGTLALGAFVHSTGAAETDWKSLGTDFNTSANWTNGTPTTASVAYFKTAETVQPNLSLTDNIAGLFFNGTGSSGYDLTRTSTQMLTLTGYNATGSSGTANSSAAAIRSENTTGTNTIDVPLVLAPASAATSVFYQASGGTLVVNGAISGSTFNLSLKGAGTIQLNGSNSFGTASIDQASTTVVLGNDGALGGGTFSINNSATIQAGGGARSIANAILLGANTTISGGNNIDFTTSVTSNVASRTLTVSNSGTTTISGSVFLATDDTTARGLTIGGASAATISGAIANNNSGNTTASPFAYNGTGTLTLTGHNTYTGATSITNGTLKAAAAGSTALGTTSGITVSNGGTLSFGAANQLSAVAPAPLTLGTGTSTVATIQVGGFSQGSTTASGVGALTLTTGSTGNVIDFGSSAGVITFASLLTNGAVLTINNYVNNNGVSGGPDQLIFNQDQTGNLASIVFTGYGAAAEQLVSGTAGTGNAFYEVYATPVPEPTTILGGALLIGAAAWSQRRRLRSGVVAA